jgi:hypothetical protein
MIFARNLQALSGDIVDKKRKDDLEKQAHFRTDRMMNHNGKWFFCTREGTFQGPFEDQLKASYQLKSYIKASASGLAGELSLVPL